MPKDLVFVRHGQSEANVVQKADKAGTPHHHANEVFERPDWRQRLSPAGIEQAKMAKLWIDEHLGGAGSFDLKYVSPFLRTRETAAYVGGLECEGWVYDDRLIERNWGIYGMVPKEVRESRFAHTAKMYKQSPWYTKLDGGSSRYDVSMPFRNFQETLHREAAGRRVIVVTHGDFINVARYNIERLLPEEFERMDKDKAQTIRNCTIVHYTRVDPIGQLRLSRRLDWMRIINPVDPDSSPYGGQWVELGARRVFSGADLLKQANAISNRLIDTESVSI